MKTIIVKAIPEAGFWRCGRFFSQKEETICDVSDEEFARIKAEQFLVVVESAPAKAADPKPDDKPKGK